MKKYWLRKTLDDAVASARNLPGWARPEDLKTLSVPAEIDLPLDQRIVPVGSLAADPDGCYRLSVPGGEKKFYVEPLAPPTRLLADPALVKNSAARFEAMFPYEYQPRYFLFEHCNRMEGWAPGIDLGPGRRTTLIGISAANKIRSQEHLDDLIAHELGHHVYNVISWRLGINWWDLEVLYSRIRKIPVVNGVWHKEVCEVFANDCRIIRFGINSDTWEHAEVCCHPRDASAPVREFWKANGIID